jgi:hypothetical protein
MQLEVVREGSYSAYEEFAKREGRDRIGIAQRTEAA